MAPLHVRTAGPRREKDERTKGRPDRGVQGAEGRRGRGIEEAARARVSRERRAIVPMVPTDALSEHRAAGSGLDKGVGRERGSRCASSRCERYRRQQLLPTLQSSTRTRPSRRRCVRLRLFFASPGQHLPGSRCGPRYRDLGPSETSWQQRRPRALSAVTGALPRGFRRVFQRLASDPVAAGTNRYLPKQVPVPRARSVRRLTNTSPFVFRARTFFSLSVREVRGFAKKSLREGIHGMSCKNLRLGGP